MTSTKAVRWPRRGDVLAAEMEERRARVVEGLDETEPDHVDVDDWPVCEGPWLATKRGCQLMFHLLDDATIRGVVLEACDRGGVLLGAPEYLGDRHEPLGGEVYIPGDRIAFIQVAPTPAP